MKCIFIFSENLKYVKPLRSKIITIDNSNEKTGKHDTMQNAEYDLL